MLEKRVRQEKMELAGAELPLEILSCRSIAGAARKALDELVSRLSASKGLLALAPSPVCLPAGLEVKNGPWSENPHDEEWQSLGKLKKDALASGSLASTPLPAQPSAPGDSGQPPELRIAACIPLSDERSHSNMGLIYLELPRQASQEERDSSLEAFRTIAKIIAGSIAILFANAAELETLRLKSAQGLSEPKGKHHSTADAALPFKRDLRKLIELAGANEKAPALIRAEQGVPVLKAALAIHNASSRKGGAFRRVDCSSTPQPLLEGEIFGPGQEQEAPEGGPGDGSVFIDEVANLSAQAQFRLLELIESAAAGSLDGSAKPKERIICASSKDLEALAAQGLFRRDLFYKVNVLPIFIAPLRERRSEIPALASAFLAGLGQAQLSKEALEELLKHSWPGNESELEDCLRWAASQCKGAKIEPDELPQYLKEALRPETPEPLQTSLERLELRLITEALRERGGNIARTAKRLSVTERILGLRIKHYGIDPKSFKQV